MIKMVYPAEEYARLYTKDSLLDDSFKDGNYSAIFSGASGSGKDTVCMALLDRDMEEGRTPIIFDVKMEYPSTIFLQQDTILANILKKTRRVPLSYKTNLWIPYIKGLEKNKHFKDLRKLHHPNLRIRPFRILTTELVSEDTKNFAVGKSFLQAMVPKSSDLPGSSGKYNLLREQIASVKLCLDDENRWEAGCGWEYFDFYEVSNNKEVNVICFFFLFGGNNVSATSFAIAMLNEFLAIGMGTLIPRSQEQVFSIYIPELQIIMPRGVKMLQETVNVLTHRMLVGFLLMRSFYCRLRVNLQNLSALPSGMFSQSRLFAGRTSNPKDLKIFGVYGYGKDKRRMFITLPKGTFMNLLERKKFSIVPKSHKAREKESFLFLLQKYHENPSNFLFETDNCYLSEIDESIVGGYPLDIQTYRDRMKEWLRIQQEGELKPLRIALEDEQVKMEKPMVYDIARARRIAKEAGIDLD